MNDDFLKRHWQRPDPKFVDRLSIQLNSTPQRSIPMSTRILRPALLVTLALFLAAALTLTFSPTARAAVQEIFSFNGVTVSVDDETGKLVTSGNLDAVVQQSDNSVTIQGEDGSMAGVAVADLTVEMLAVAELLERFPDLVLPDVPEGYTLAPEGQLTDDGTLTFTWTNAVGQMISYVRSSSPPENIILTDVIGDVDALPGETGTLSEDGTAQTGGAYPITAVVVGTGSALEFPEGDLEVIPVESSETIVESSGPLALYTWESSGYFHMLFTSNPELSEADLQAMQP